jgi:transcriptional regulator with XRE-family HTH domain
MDLSGFPSLLDRAFLEFRIKQTRQRLSVSLNSFASFLDFSPPIVNTWLNGNRLPSPGNVERMIPKLVELLDVEVYDLLGLPRPDLTLQRLTEAWPRIPPEYRQKLVELGEMYAAGKDSIPGEVSIQDQSANLSEESIQDQETILKEESIQDQDNILEESVQNQDTILKEESIQNQDIILNEDTIQNQETIPNEGTIQNHDNIPNKDKSSTNRGKGQEELF